MFQKVGSRARAAELSNGSIDSCRPPRAPIDLRLPPSLKPFSQAEAITPLANLVRFKKELPYIYRGRREDRKGQPCRMLIRGNKNRCLVEFADGVRMSTSRNALRKVRPGKHDTSSECET